MKSPSISLVLLLIAAHSAVMAAAATLGSTPDMEELVQALAKQGRDRSLTANNKSEAVALSKDEPSALVPEGVFDSGSNKGTCTTSLFDGGFFGFSVDISLTVCAPITIFVTLPFNIGPFGFPIPGLGGCLCDEDGLSARGFYFQQYGDISLAVSEEEEETRFIIFPPGQISESKAVELGASLPVGSCKFCPQGTYQPEVAFNCEGLDSCKFCPAGYVPSEFQVETDLGQEGAAECFKCKSGTYSAGNGAVGVAVPGTNLATCHKCEPGTFAPNAGAAECILCAAGTAQDEAGASSCHPCSAGTFSNGGGAESCTQCKAGTFTANEASEECHKCEPGTAQPYPGKDSCFVCEPGTFTSASGAQACEPCRPGTFAPNFGSDGCELCPKGTFTNRFGQVECTKCPKWSTSEGSTSCTDSEKFDEALEDKAAEGKYKYDD